MTLPDRRGRATPCALLKAAGYEAQRSSNLRPRVRYRLGASHRTIQRQQQGLRAPDGAPVDEQMDVEVDRDPPAQSVGAVGNVFDRCSGEVSTGILTRQTSGRAVPLAS